jgi:isocitrate dehydrogenase kinase/phosphatase
VVSLLGVSLPFILCPSRMIEPPFLIAECIVKRSQTVVVISFLISYYMGWVKLSGNYSLIETVVFLYKLIQRRVIVT